MPRTRSDKSLKAHCGRLLARCAVVLAWTLVVGACAFNSVQPGMSRQDVLARMGQPTREMPLATGLRLQYSRQPAGRQVFNVDLDPSNHVLQVRQMLVEPEFARIAAGQWTRVDVLREFGPPASVDHVASWPSDILTYRWHAVEDMFFWIYLDQNNVVQRTEQGVEYHTDM